MRRFYYLVLSLPVVLVAVLAVHVSGQESNSMGPTFSDVDSNSRYYPAVEYLHQKGVIEGYEDGTFKPEQKVNRAEALKIVLLGSNQNTNSAQPPPFPDTGSGAWYAPYVSLGVELKIVQGYPDGTFKPEQTVNKVESLKMLLLTNTVSLPTVHLTDTALFNDTLITPENLWYQPYLFFARASNIIQPKNIYLFDPGTTVTRGELAESMYRLAFIQENHVARFNDSQNGIASYYGDSFNGRRTSSGEPFFNDFFSAAHRFWPFGMFLQVVNTNTGESVLTRVNDRGPYVADRIVDLSQSAFSAVESLSRGLANVKIIPLGVIPNVTKGWIEREQFLDTNNPQVGVTLDKPAPNIFFTNEAYLFTGTTAAPAKVVTVLVTNKTSHVKMALQTPVIDQRFSIQVPFDTAGNYSLSIIPDAVGIGYADVFVLSDTDLQPAQLVPNTAAPGNVAVSFINDTTTVSWDKNGNNTFRIYFQQGDKEVVWYAGDRHSFDIPYESFRDFTADAVTVFVEGAKSSTDFSMDRYTTWSHSAEVAVQAVQHEYAIYKKEKIGVQTWPLRRQNGAIALQGVGQIPLENSVWYTLPDGTVQSVAITPASQLEAGQSFSITIPAPEEGTYIVEVNDTNGEAVLNYPVYSNGKIPLLPNLRDLKESFSSIGTINLASERTKMLAKINQERAKLSLPALQLNSTLNTLALSRSDDMSTRNYFSHYTPEGKTIADLQGEYGLTGSIGENIAKDVNTVLGLYGLFRSPVHRSLLLSGDVQKIGIGITKTSDGQVVVTQVLQ